jgi:large subunit ribosomal protein L6
MIKGVQDGYQKQLEISGTGFKVAAQGQTLTLSIGFSHPVVYELPKGIAVSIEKNTITLNGIDKQLVGETAAQIRRLRPPDAYKGKGIRIVGEIIKLKPGKQAKATAAAA